MGICIALEGIDGSGKTTMLSMLVDNLNFLGMSTKLINKKKVDYEDIRIKRYTTTLSELIWYKNDDPNRFVTDQGWLFFHALWYSILVENTILPNLNNYDLLIVDGWFYKIYCRFLLKNSFNKMLLEMVYNSIRKCDRVIMIDTSPELCWKRRKDFNYREMGGYDFCVQDQEKAYIEYQTKVRRELLKLADEEQWNIIDNNDTTIEETVDKICKSIILDFK